MMIDVFYFVLFSSLITNNLSEAEEESLYHLSNLASLLHADTVLFYPIQISHISSATSIVVCFVSSPTNQNNNNNSSKNNNKDNKDEEQHQRTSSSSSSSQLLPPPPLKYPCISCGSAEREYACVPCGHRVWCTRCVDTHYFCTCPACDKIISTLVKTFL